MCRVANLKLGAKHGPACWKAHNARTAALVKDVKQRLDDANKRILETNQRRKLQQEKAQATLGRLNKNYMDVVAKNVSIETACRKLEDEIQDAHAAQGRAASASNGAAGVQTTAVNGVSAQVDAGDVSPVSDGQGAPHNRDQDIDRGATGEDAALLEKGADE